MHRSSIGGSGNGALSHLGATGLPQKLGLGTHQIRNMWAHHLKKKGSWAEGKGRERKAAGGVAQHQRDLM